MICHQSGSFAIEYRTQKLLERMLNPICGLTQEIGFIKRSKFGARIYTAGADITGVHHLLGQKDPGRGAYHTGGTGVYLNEPIIKSLGETIERYSQLIVEKSQRDFIFLPYKEMYEKHNNVLTKEYLDLYTLQQLHKNQFPFQAFDESLPLSWIKARSLISEDFFYIPTQLLLVGYKIKRHLREPWYSTAVTTGTAAHTDLIEALLGAILEIIQIDSTMGHWYSNYSIPEIKFDKRTKLMRAVLQKYGNLAHNSARFFWLQNPDLGGISVACLLERSEKSIPRISVGLGSSTSLNDALYKAYLEAIGVASLSSLLILRETLYQRAEQPNISKEIYDIDRNVALYGQGCYSEIIKQKFNDQYTINASDIPPDLPGNKIHQLKLLIDSFSSSAKELLFIDLTNIEARELGFYVPRLWSKDTLSLCFPDAPPIKHPRFKQYGGFANDIPHPYP